MAERLTDPFIKDLSPRLGASGKLERNSVQDAGSGLTLRVWPNGTKTWSLWYRSKTGPSRRIAIGRYPDMTLAAARKRARQIRSEVDAGRDPQGERRAAKEAHRTRTLAPRLSSLLDKFVADQSPSWRPATREGTTRYIDVDIKPALGSRIPAEVTPDDVVRFLEDLKGKRGPVSVARCYEALRRAFRWAAARRLIPSNPMSVLDAGELVARARMSSRVYTDAELLGILAGAAATPYRLLVPWLLLTGARSGEARAAEWRDFEGALWTVPAEKSKTGVAHRVPLSPGALAVLDELRSSTNGAGSDYLFPAFNRSGFLGRNSKTVSKIQRISGVQDFGLHHLRRTVRQRLADAGVAPHVAEAVLGHLPPKIVRTYNPRWEPLPEMRAALEAWSLEVQRIARGAQFFVTDPVPTIPGWSRRGREKRPQ